MVEQRVVPVGAVVVAQIVVTPLVVLFDQRTTVGMVRLRVKQTVHDLGELFQELFGRTAPEGGPPSTPRRGVLEGAEDEIDKLFGD